MVINHQALEKSFESDTQFQLVLKAVQEGQLIDKDATQGKALGGKQAFGGNLSMSIKDALDSSGISTRDARWRGTGWLAGQADSGWSNRIGWYEGFHLLTSITPTGVITGFGFAAMLAFHLK